MQIFSDIVVDGVLYVPRASLKCRFYNGRGDFAFAIILRDAEDVVPYDCIADL